MKERLIPQKLVVPIKALPSLPASAAQVLRAANNPSASSVDLERIIIQDQAVAAQVLKVANSAVYGFRRRLETLRDAVVALGLRKIRCLASAIALAPMFEDREFVSGARLWGHALATAMWTQEISQRLRFQDTDYVFTAGLMHDIGLVVLSMVAPAEFGQTLEQAQAEGITHEEAEKKYLGTTHARVGAALCAKWMLPAGLTQLISYHHSDPNPEEPAAQILHLADHLANRTGMSSFSWQQVPPLPEGLLSSMELSGEDIKHLRASQDDIEQHVAAFSEGN